MLNLPLIRETFSCCQSLLAALMKKLTAICHQLRAEGEQVSAISCQQEMDSAESMSDAPSHVSKFSDYFTEAPSNKSEDGDTLLDKYTQLRACS